MFLRRRRGRLEEALHELRRGDSRGRIVFERTLPATAAAFGEPAVPLSKPLSAALEATGVQRLYSHQAETLDAVCAGRNVVLVTPTASGKTLAFLLPVLERLLVKPATKALFVYPTNALINDQERVLASLLACLPAGLSAGVLTGATSLEQRRAYRSSPPNILLTNPEMLHMSLLGQHRAWAGFLRGLEFVVLDELHQYRGLFGSHMAMVMRRLHRIATLYGSTPHWIACSATIGNAGEVAERIAGVPFKVIEGSGAARGPRTLIIWQPALLRHGDRQEREDASREAVRIFGHLISGGLGSILFSLSRAGAESMSLLTREQLGAGLVSRVAPYRSGYAPEQRREIEEGLKRGDLLGVVSTNALEVGIDIGGLDAAIIAGFPGSRSSFWQQAGRAGRGTRASLIAFVPFDRIVDRYYAEHPERLIDGRFEDGIVDLANPSVLRAHMRCAAVELPLQQHELDFFSPGAEEVALAAGPGQPAVDRGSFTALGESVHAAVGLRGSAGTPYAIMLGQKQLGSMDAALLHREAYPGAVYLHLGRRYRVTACDDQLRRVTLRPEPAFLATKPVLQTVVEVQRGAAPARATPAASLTFDSGPVLVQELTVAFREQALRGARTARLVPLAQTVAHELPTAGWWMVFPESLRRSLEARQPGSFLSGLHALEHVLPAAVSLRLLCDPRDVVAVYEPHHDLLGGAALFLFDDRAGGAGIAERAALHADDVMRAAFEIIRGCGCRDGCPGCIVSSSCWRQYDEASKGAALAIAAELERALTES